MLGAIALGVATGAVAAPTPLEPPRTATKVPAPARTVVRGEDGRWLTSHAKAEVLARVRRRPILMFFTGSDWCGWCKKLVAESLSHDEFRRFAAESLVLLELDFPRAKQQPERVQRQNRRLLDTFGVEGFPTLILMDSRGKKELGRLGYTRGGAPGLIEAIRRLIPR
jgi:protein disulfide-isomerase